MPLPLGVPDRLFLTALLKRALFFWLVPRAFLTLATRAAPAELGGFSLALSFEATLALVLLVAFLGLLEARRRNEHLFLANLGVSQPTIAVVSAMPALAMEVLVWMLGAIGRA